MTCTALMIIPQPDPPEPEECLETTGPVPTEHATVHYAPGWFMGGGEFMFHRPDCPRHEQRSPIIGSDWVQQQNSTRRIIALLDQLWATDPMIIRQVAEIRYRICILNPPVL